MVGGWLRREVAMLRSILLCINNNNNSCDDIGWVSNILARNGFIVLVFYTR